MATIKFSDIVRNYESSDVSGDFTVWVEKLELVAQLQNVTDKLKFLPLFLTGAAFSVYQQLSDEAKGDYDKLKAELTTAFSSNAFVAYEHLRERVLREGEAVDVYLADLRRLVSLIGQQNSDPILRCAFVAGLPSEVSVHLKSIAGLDKMALCEIVAKARAMMASKVMATAFGCAAVAQVQRGRSRECFNCRGIGHVARNCPSPRLPPNDVQRAPRKCYICQSTEHLANKCNQRSGNGKGAASASDVCPANTQ